MSYCRWSSDDFRCDVYVYGAAEGYVTHVAGRRPIFTEQMPEAVIEPGEDGFNAERWLARHQKVMGIVQRSEHEDISLPHAGESFVDATPGEAADRLEALLALGYNVPRYAIDELREEAAAG